VPLAGANCDALCSDFQGLQALCTDCPVTRTVTPLTRPGPGCNALYTARATSGIIPLPRYWSGLHPSHWGGRAALADGPDHEPECVWARAGPGLLLRVRGQEPRCCVGWRMPSARAESKQVEHAPSQKKGPVVWLKGSQKSQGLERGIRGLVERKRETPSEDGA
jgi:hypothetical protein